MCRKLIFLISLVLVLGSSAHAGLYVWNGSAGDSKWDTALNWTVTDSAWTWPNEETGGAYINNDVLGIDIIDGGAVGRMDTLRIKGADELTTAVLTLDNASSLSVNGRLSIGTDPDGAPRMGELNVLGGSILTIFDGPNGNDLYAADDPNTVGTINIVDSTVTVFDNIVIDEGEGYINISGSSIVNADAIIIADANTAVGYLDISGTAVITLVDDFKIDEGIGTITIGGDAVINFGDDCYIPDKSGQGTMTLTGNSVFNVGDDMTIADDANTVGHLIVTGNATLNAPDELMLADANTAFATLDISGNATVNIGDDLNVGEDGPAICNIGENATVTVADTIYIPHNSGEGVYEASMTISGNATVTCNDLQVVNDAGNTGYLHISGNPTIHTAENFYMNNDEGDSAYSQVIMDGGTVTVDGYTTFNDDVNGTAEFIMNGGSFYSADYLNLSDNLDGTAHLTMNGGEMITGDRLRLGKDGGEDTGQVRIFMNGGLLQAEELSDIMITDTKIIYTGGEIRIRQPFQPDPNDPNTTWGLSKADMQDLIDTGIIEVNDVYSIITIGDYTVLNPKPPMIAKVPTPADVTVDIAFDVDTLEWIAGDTAVTHNVYLSTDETIDESDLLGETKLTSITVALAAGTTYYWRVDEVEAYTPEPWESWDIELTGRVEHEGEVWSFTTVHVEAYSPSPSDGATSVGLDAQLSWSAGMDAIMHDVYFGTDKEAVAASDPNDPNTFMGTQMETSFDPGPLELSTTYYWKVDEVGVIATQAGPLWSFTTEEPLPPPEPPVVVLLAFDPEPEDGAENTTQSPVLAFSADAKAVEHDVYFGDDADAVADADADTADIYVGRQAETSLDAGDLELNKTYYWRVDEVNDAEADSPWKGEVWSFTTADYLIIDDSETILDYDNSVEPYTTEASWDTPADLTVSGVTDLQFRFHGRPALQDSASLDEPNGIYTVIGSGADIAGSSDQFHYLYRKLKGDGEIIAKVESVQNTDDGAKAGVMIRETLDADSANALAYITPNGQVGLQYRAAAGKDTDGIQSDPNTITAPHWVKLARQGDIITAQHSSDGDTWEDENSLELVMKEGVYIGLAVTSHSAGETCEAQFSDVSTTGNVDSAAANKDVGMSNSAEQLYLALEDSAGALGVVTHPNPAATLIDQWWTMKVPLLSFSDAGVDVADAAKLYIGVGDVNVDVNDVNNLIVGGYGSMRIDNIRGVKPIVILEAADVTAPGDNVRGVPEDGAGEAPLAVDDDAETKYLHLKGAAAVIDPNADPTGFQITPLAGASIVTGLTFTTADDAAECDPIAFELSGSNVSIDGPYNLIASGDIVDFSDPNEWPRLTKNETPISVENATVYKHYQVLFPAIRDAESANSVQIAEVELIGVTEDVLVDITSPGDTIYGYPTDGDWPSSESPLKALDNNIETNYRHKKGEDIPTGFVVNPSKKKVVNRLSFTTADDAPERDPVAFKFYGSNDDVYSGPWTLIASGTIDDFNQETPWPRMTKNEMAIVFDNDVAYKHYRLLITEVRDPGSADSMQLAEVELIEALD